MSVEKLKDLNSFPKASNELQFNEFMRGYVTGQNNMREKIGNVRIWSENIECTECKRKPINPFVFCGYGNDGGFIYFCNFKCMNNWITKELELGRK